MPSEDGRSGGRVGWWRGDSSLRFAPFRMTRCGRGVAFGVALGFRRGHHLRSLRSAKGRGLPWPPPEGGGIGCLLRTGDLVVVCDGGGEILHCASFRSE